MNSDICTTVLIVMGKIIIGGLFYSLLDNIVIQWLHHI